MKKLMSVTLVVVMCLSFIVGFVGCKEDQIPIPVEETIPKGDNIPAPVEE